MVIELEKKFIGDGEVRGFVFAQVYKEEKFYIYEVKIEDEISHYELVERNTSPVCLDFNSKSFSDTDQKEIYPRSNSFGKNGWSFKTKEDCMDKIQKLKNNEQGKILLDI